MNFFRRLYLKLSKPRKTEQPQSQPVVSTPIINEVSKMEPKYTESIAFTAVEVDYLTRYPDVKNHEYFGSHPYEHYIKHGKAEGRTWGIQEVKVPQATLPVQDEMVTTPRGRRFPRPRPDLGEMFMAYTVRVGESQGKYQEALNIQGTLQIAATPLFNKHGGFKLDGSNWAAAAEDWLFPEPVAADPGWQQVHEKMQEPRKPKVKAPVSELPPEEEPL